MSGFRRITEAFWASPQIGLEDVGRASELGFALIINNRPEREAEDQVAGTDIEAAARDAGLDYRAIPVTHSGFSEDQVEAMVAALEDVNGPVLAYCRSGTRSTLLWALAQSRKGREPDAVAAEAASAGYDVGPIRLLMDRLAARADKPF